VNRRFELREVASLLCELASADRDAVLVGGQAVGVWATRYVQAARAVGDPATLATKDIDFIGDRSTLRAFARQAGVDRVDPQFPDLDHVVAGQLGIVSVTMPDGHGVNVDVLANLVGVDGKEVQATRVPVTLYRGEAVMVMHPALIMENAFTTSSSSEASTTTSSAGVLRFAS
jgi:hypothetical protein